MYFDPTPRISPAPVLGRWAAAATALAALLVVATGIGAEPIVAALDNALLLP
jgi:UDP-N-acetylmuramyl pentapeptide synthase